MAASITRMQVFEVEDGMVVQPNCAYIIPPNGDMAFLNGTLQLMEPSSPRGQRLLVDFFFRSLAQDQRERHLHRAFGHGLATTPWTCGQSGARAVGLAASEADDKSPAGTMNRLLKKDLNVRNFDRSAWR